MRREVVDSESIASIGYAPQRRVLEIEFRESGDVYRYFDVSEEEHAEFMAVPSKGTYLNQVFKAFRVRFQVFQDLHALRTASFIESGPIRQ